MSETSMFDFSDFYNRIAIALPDDCKVCEVGVANGDSALYLAGRLHDLGKKFKMYMVDDLSYGQYIQMKTIYENIIKSGLGEFIEVIPYDSVTASKLFNDNYLHFCFVDSSHEYQETKDSIRAWYEKVLDGGTLAGHDFFGHVDVMNAVSEVIPEQITRPPIVHENEDVDTFEPEQFLHVEATTKGYGVWYCVKDFYKKLK